MRSPVALLMLWSATAIADPAATPPVPPPPPAVPAAPAPSEAPGAVEDVPEACRDFAKLATSQSKNAALSAQISLATCLVDQRSKSLVLCDCEQSVLDVNAVLEPSLLMLDQVYVAGDPATKILARHAQGEMLSSFAARMLATVPPPATNTEAATALRDTRLAMVQPLVQPWQARAQAVFSDLDKIARANPQLAKNAAVVAAVRSGRAKLSSGVAKR